MTTPDSARHSLTEAVLHRVTSFYLASSDFNGIQAGVLIGELEISHEELKNVLVTLIESKQLIAAIDVLNPNIRRLPDRDTVDQIARITGTASTAYCIYPSPKTLETAVDRSKYSDRPFTLELALGSLQLAVAYFDLSVLEVYRNDPRYRYETNDVAGWLSVRDEYYQSDQMSERDQISLQSFGFGYSKEYDRAVAVFLRYLNDLSPEHQKIWNARRLQGDYKLHPDYYRSTILGEWPEKISVFDAFIGELAVINEMAICIKGIPLFRSDFHDKPRGFGFLVRPTSKEFDDFVHLMDKMLTENLNRVFFAGEVPLEEDTPRPDGKIVVTQIGTIRLLESWFEVSFRAQDPEPLRTTFATLREIRRLRQRPAHSVDDHVFDQRFFKEQRELIMKGCDAVRTIRQCLANHPATEGVEISDALFEGKIWTM